MTNIHLKPIWLMWSVSSSIFHSRQRKSGGEPCIEKWVMMSFSLAMDFHFLYSSSTFFFRLKRDSWGTLFCLKKAWMKWIGVMWLQQDKGIRLKENKIKHIYLFVSVKATTFAPVVEQGSRTECVRPSYEVWSSWWSGECLYTKSHGWSLTLWKSLHTNTQCLAIMHRKQGQMRQINLET